MRMQSTRGALLAFAILTVAGCDQDTEQEAARAGAVEEIEAVPQAVLENLPPGVTAETLEQGREAYVVCAVCHGFDGEGTALGPSLRDDEWIHIDGSPAEISMVIRAGVAEPSDFPIPMPEMGGGDFTDEELQALSVYVNALSVDSPPTS